MLRPKKTFPLQRGNDTGHPKRGAYDLGAKCGVGLGGTGTFANLFFKPTPIGSFIRKCPLWGYAVSSTSGVELATYATYYKNKIPLDPP